MRKKLTQYGLTAALAMGAAGILPANVYGAVNTYNLPGGNGKMIVISGGNENCFPGNSGGFPDFDFGQIPGWPGNGGSDNVIPGLPDTDIPGDDFPDSDFPDHDIPGNEDGNVSSQILQVLDLVNEERAKAGVSPLTLNQKAVSAAQVRAQEIAVNFSHTRPDGTGYSTALKAAGLNFTRSGENIAYGQRSAEAVMNSWMNSSGHRANILSSQYDSIGIGHYQNASGVNYWVQLFVK